MKQEQQLCLHFFFHHLRQLYLTTVYQLPPFALQYVVSLHTMHECGNEGALDLYVQVHQIHRKLYTVCYGANLMIS
jgi:hypothetical protein